MQTQSERQASFLKMIVDLLTGKGKSPVVQMFNKDAAPENRFLKIRYYLEQGESKDFCIFAHDRISSFLGPEWAYKLHPENNDSTDPQQLISISRGNKTVWKAS